jgi:oxygen-dependent protoporphyrinogen oxidase
VSHVAVVGGGIAGLAAAYALHIQGVDVVVLEAAARAGGKLRTADVGGVVVDEGAEALLTRRPAALDLARAVGLAAELVAPAMLAASVWSRGRLHPLPRGTALGVPSDPRTLRGLLTGAELLRAAADRALPRTPLAEDVAVGRYVAARLGRAVVDRVVDPLLGGVYAGSAESLSLAATVPDLARAARRHRSLLRAAADAVPPPRPGPVFQTVRGGLGRLADAVAARLDVRSGVTVRRMQPTATGWRLTAGPTGDPTGYDADAVILAVPPPAARRLLAGVAPHVAADLAGIETASVAVVTLAYPEPVPVPGSGFLVPAVEGRLVKGVTASSAKWGLPGPPYLVRCSVGRAGDTTDLRRDDADLAAAAAADLAAMTGVTAAPVDARVSRWGGGLPQYAVGHLDRVARIRAGVGRLPALAVCGAAYDGIGVAACVESGQRAAHEIAAALARR